MSKIEQKIVVRTNTPEQQLEDIVLAIEQVTPECFKKFSYISSITSYRLGEVEGEEFKETRSLEIFGYDRRLE